MKKAASGQRRARTGHLYWSEDGYLIRCWDSWRIAILHASAYHAAAVRHENKT